MKDLLDRISIDPNVCNGKPIIRGTRVTVQTILEFLASGDRIDEIVLHYPSLQPDDVRAAMQFAARMLGNEFSIKAVA